MHGGFGTLRALLAAGVLALAGCAVPPGQGPGQETLSPVAFSALPGWASDRQADAMPAFLATCAGLAQLPPDQKLGGQGLAAQLAGTPALWQPACNAARAVPANDDAAARSFFETWFQPYAVGDNGRREGLFTGYFEPEVRGSRYRTAQYRTPVLAPPHDLLEADLGQFDKDLAGRRITGRVEGSRLVPFPTRQEIEDGAVSSRDAILWLADPIDLFFLQIQGAGRVRLPNGQIVRIGFAAKNGRPYVPIGRVLVERGALAKDQVSMQNIRAWLEAHPDQARAVMDENPSYVFFRVISGLSPDQGPPGALGVALTPDRSIAVDRNFVPLGAPVFIDTTLPAPAGAPAGTRPAPLQRLTFAQDLGGAISGAVRADIFFGWGPEAEQRAGQMHQPGHAYLLLPRPPAKH